MTIERKLKSSELEKYPQLNLTLTSKVTIGRKLIQSLNFSLKFIQKVADAKIFSFIYLILVVLKMKLKRFKENVYSLFHKLVIVCKRKIK